MKHPAIVALVLLSALTTAYATPVQWGGNGHYYERVDLERWTQWDEHRQLAESMSFNGISGHLVTITSAQEQQFIEDFVLNEGIGHNYAIGARRASMPGGPWEWITGEAWGEYENWAAGQGTDPNDEVGEIYSREAPNPFKWNDELSTSTMDGFVVEYVPEPATMGLLALGGLALLKRRNR